MKIIMFFLLLLTLNSQAKETKINLDTIDATVNLSVNFNVVRKNGKERNVHSEDISCILDRILSYSNKTATYECYAKHEKKGKVKSHYTTLEYKFDYYPEKRTIKTLQVTTINKPYTPFEVKDNLFKNEFRSKIYRVPRITIEQDEEEIYKSLLNSINQENERIYSVEIIRK